MYQPTHEEFWHVLYNGEVCVEGNVVLLGEGRSHLQHTHLLVHHDALTAPVTRKRSHKQL